MSVKNITRIGAGYVGGPTMAVIAMKCPQYKITVTDVNESRLAAWQTDKLQKNRQPSGLKGNLKPPDLIACRINGVLKSPQNL